MLISTRGRYALRVLIDLARHQNQGYVPLKEIAGRQEISEKYLESIIKVLIKEHLLEGQRGKGGGYRLTREPDQYTAGQILRLTEGSLSPVSCLENQGIPCPRAKKCPTLPLWKNLDSLIEHYLDSVTVSMLAEGLPEFPIDIVG